MGAEAERKRGKEAGKGCLWDAHGSWKWQTRRSDSVTRRHQSPPEEKLRRAERIFSLSFSFISLWPLTRHWSIFPWHIFPHRRHREIFAPFGDAPMMNCSVNWWHTISMNWWINVLDEFLTHETHSMNQMSNEYEKRSIKERERILWLIDLCSF